MYDDIDEYLKQCSAEGLSQGTIVTKRRILRMIIRYFMKKGKEGPTEFTSQDLDEYFMLLFQTGIKQSVRRARASVIRGFFQWLAENGKIISDPTRHISVPDDDDKLLMVAPLEEAEVAQLIEGLPRATAIDLRNYAHIELLYSCALRIAESLMLDVRDVDLNNNVLHVRHGKGSKGRVLPLMRGVAGALRDYLVVRRSLLRGPDTGALLLNGDGRRLTPVTFRRWMKRLNKARGIGARHIHPHLFRHSIAVHLLRAGADIRYIQEFLGHSKLNTTKIYLRLVPERLKDDYEKAMPIIPVTA